MISLLKKDLMLLRQMLVSLSILVLVWMVIGIMMDMPEFFSGLAVMFAIMLPLNTMTYDEKAKWNLYALTMPISKRDLVLSKYLLGGGAAVLCSLLALGIGLLASDPIDVLAVCGATLAVAVIMLDILLPLIFKFGVEKSRFIFILAFFIPTGGAYLLKYLNIPAPSLDTISALIRMSPVFIIALTLLSIFLSIRIVKRKEL